MGFSLQEVVEKASKSGKKRLAIAVAQDTEVLTAAAKAMQVGISAPILIGDSKLIIAAARQAKVSISDMEIIHEPDRQLACVTAVKLINENRADILMKGIVSTSVFMKSILDKENGLLESHTLSHVAFFESPYYHKVICVTDAALNISPDINEKVAIIKNAVAIYHRFGIKLPRVAVLAPVETVNTKIEATVHAAILATMQKRNQIEGCIIDGPLALDNAVSTNAAGHKGLISEVAGNADILVVPDLNSGNILYKSLVFLGGAVSAAIVIGARVPVVLTSRADLDKSKFLSIALAGALV
jgi:phosphate butyryltransferase